MVKVYGITDLAKWHVEHTNPDLVPYLRTPNKPSTDGDAMLQLEFAKDIISDEREALKVIFQDGKVTPDELARMNLSVNTLRSIAEKIISAVEYLEERGTSAEGGV